jgi:hypothetical protein
LPEKPWFSWCIAVLIACLAVPAGARADVQTIDFDSDSSGTVLGAPVEGAGDISFPLGHGFRPYRVDVGARAHSGTTVGSLSECAPETELLGGSAGECEFFQARTGGVLARTAKSVTIYAGRLGPVGPFDEPEQATLVAFDTSGNPVASSGKQPITDAAFDTRLSVASARGNIAGFVVMATGGVDGANEFASDLGIDDVSVSFAEGGDPDFSVSATSQVLPLVQGQQVAVPVRINRINGSNGPVDLSVSDLPQGVEAEPVTIPAGSSTATLTLSAAPDAPSTDFVPVEATITADPRGDASVAPGPRETTLSVRVARDYTLSAGGRTENTFINGSVLSVDTPDCAPSDLTVKVSRDIAFNRTVTLSLHERGEAGLPDGLGAEILPSPEVPPGGALTAERTIRFRAGPNANLRRFLVLEARIPGDPSSPPHELPIELSRTQPKAVIENSGPGAILGRTGRFGHPGARFLVHGTGFCSGTMIDIGNHSAPVQLIDEHTLEFELPRNATKGRPLVLPPSGLSPYRIQQDVNVDSFRNVDGFQFENWKLGQISLNNMVRAYGVDDLFVKVNPCWPWGSCEVITPLLNPIAALDWGVMNVTVPIINHVGRSGHCFGMTFAIRQLLSGEESLRQFPGPDGSHPVQMVHEIGTEARPQSGQEISDFLTAEQIKQFSAEGISAWFSRPKSIPAQIRTIEEEFAHRRPAVVSVSAGAPLHAHVVLAYDMERKDDLIYLYTYEPNTPFTADENSNPEWHDERVEHSRIIIDTTHNTWVMPKGDTYLHGGAGELWAIPKGKLPQDLSLPGLGTIKDALAWIFFGSSEGTVEAIASDTFMPLFGGTGGGSATGGTWIGHAGHPLDVKFIGRKSGSYDESYTAPGFLASTENVLTQAGVRDEVDGSGHSIEFHSGADRPLKVEIAERGGVGIGSGASLTTHASAGGSDSAGFLADGDLTYAHEGAPTTLRFTLTTVRREGGPTTFVSPPVQVRDGDRVRVSPLGRGGNRVRVRIRNHGAVRTRVLHTRANARGSVMLGKAKLSGRRLAIRVGVLGLGRRAIGGVTLRLMRGKHVLARKAMALRRAAGSHRISWRLPRSLRSGRYRLVADARALTGPTPGVNISASASAHRARAIELR